MRRTYNAVAVVRPKPGQVQTERAVDLHPNILNKELEVIGQVPKLMATWLTRFLKRHTNCEKVVIKGKRVNRGGGFGLEVPCEYIFEGDNFSCEWLHRKLIEEKFDAEHCLSSLIQCNQGTMMKVKTVWYSCVVTVIVVSRV